MINFEKITDPKKLYKNLLIVLTANLLLITLMIFTMGEEIKVYFIGLFVMVLAFLLIMIYYSKIVFKEKKE